VEPDAWRRLRYHLPEPDKGRRGDFVTRHLASVVLAAGLVTACGTAVTKSAAAPTSPAQTSASGSPRSGAAVGSLGTTFKVSAISDRGSPAVYEVALLSVNQAAGHSLDTAPAGRHLVSAEFKVTGVSGRVSENADIDAAVIGTNKRVYHSTGSRLAAGTSFNSGEFTVSPHRTEVGYVAFELPDSVTVTSVTWTPSLVGTGGAWTAG
jgi:hypothetical protein